MPEKSKSYFTIGEFAKLFGMSKQTLFYYEKNHIFVPALIEDNGYRYYSLEQYFVFEIIISLRKLGISLKEIGEYVNNRNIDSLQQLFLDKAMEFDLQIDMLQRNKHNLLINMERLKQAKEITHDRITLEYDKEAYFVADDFPASQVSLKDRIKVVAQHNLPFAKSEIFNEYFMGYLLSREDLLSENYLSVSQIFTQVSYPDEHPKAVIKPKGLYVKISIPEGYHSNYHRAIKKALDFIQLNNLEVVGNAYVFQLSNYWSTANPEEYVTQIAIHVEYEH